MFDINIQFFNYIFSLLAVVFAGMALYLAWTEEKKRDEEIKDLRERINTVARYNENNKKK
jgi:predicted tellurium resistance membrane protein TerC